MLLIFHYLHVQLANFPIKFGNGKDYIIHTLWNRRTATRPSKKAQPNKTGSFLIFQYTSLVRFIYTAVKGAQNAKVDVHISESVMDVVFRKHIVAKRGKSKMCM